MYFKRSTNSTILDIGDVIGWQQVITMRREGPFTKVGVRCRGCNSADREYYLGPIVAGNGLMCRSCWWSMVRRIGLAKARLVHAGMARAVAARYSPSPVKRLEALTKMNGYKQEDRKS